MNLGQLHITRENAPKHSIRPEIGGCICICLALLQLSIDVTACDQLSFLAFQQNGADGVSGLDSVTAIAVSPDHAHVYAAARDSDTLVVFKRNKASGRLSFQEVYKDGVNGIDGLDGAFSVTVSPDGAHVYVAGLFDDAVAVFTRDPGSGLLTFVEVHKDGVNGTDGLKGALAVRVSPDGRHLYAAGRFDDAVAVFARDANTGMLTFLEFHRDGVNGVDGLAAAYSVPMSPDGKSMYVAGLFDDAIVHFQRDAQSGLLSFITFHKNGTDGIDGLHGPISTIVSPDGLNLYVANVFGDTVSAFSRDSASGGADLSGIAQGR